MNKRKFIKNALLSVGVALAGFKPRAVFSMPWNTEFTLPPLPYGYADLEPYIDAQTMEIHYSKHHAAYVQNLNKALKALNKDFLPIENICAKISEYDMATRNNGGGHYNHAFFWRILAKPNSTQPSKNLLKVIEKDFKTLENFKTEFQQKALSHFGSGWAWLIVTPKKNLQITTTPNQDNPLMDIAEVKGIPVLGVDVWEHAYYLKYQNKRADYLLAFWNVLNWNQVEKNYQNALKAAKG